MVKLDADARSVAQPQTWFTLASVPRTRPGGDSTAGSGAIEAPFIFKKFDYFYLFASYDYCCRGAKSTYKMRVGRSKTLAGPYLDKDGVPMTQGGGTLLLEGNAEWHGVGHNAVCTFDGVDYLVFQGYDAKDKGRSKLRVEVLKWENSWPVMRH